MNIGRLRIFVVWLLYAALVAVPLLYFKKGVYPYVLGKTLIFQAIVEVMFFAWLALAIADARYRPRWTPVMRGMAIFIGALILTSLLGEDISRSIWSTQERAGGIALFLHMAAVAIVVSSLISEIKFERLLGISLGASTIVSILAFLQLRIPNLLLVESVGNRPGATFGNPTFFAGYLGFNIFIALYFLLEAIRQAEKCKKSPRVWFLGTVFAVNCIALFITQTRGDIVGIGAAIAAILVLLAMRPFQMGPVFLKKQSFYWIVLAVSVIGIAGFWFTRANPIWKSVPGMNRFASVSLEDRTLLPRIIAINASWKGFLEKPLTGWGWENFNLAYNKYYDPRALEFNYQETRFDKPHNLYLEYLATGGIVLFLAFLFFMYILMREASVLKNDHLRLAFLAGFVAYLARSAFVFDTIGPLLMLYLFAGIIDGLRKDAPQSTSQKREAKNLAVGMSMLSWLLIAAGIGLAYGINALSLRATYYQYYAYKYFFANRPQQAITNFKKAVATPTPYVWNLKRDYATTMSEAYFYNPTLVPKEEAEAAVRAMEDVIRAHPKDAFYRYTIVDMYNLINSINPEYYIASAEREAAVALELSPDRQEIYFSLAKTKSLKSEFDEAGKLLEYAVSLSPEVADAHFYYGLIAFAQEMPDIGYREIKEALRLGRGWKNEREPRVVANFFADYGYLDEAIELYNASLAIKEDAEARIKLGIAYYSQGDRVEAIENISKALKEIDITKSPWYADYLPILQDMGLMY